MTLPHGQPSTLLGQCAQHNVGKHGYFSCYTQAERKKLDRGVVRPLLPHKISKEKAVVLMGGNPVSTRVDWIPEEIAGIL